MKKYLEVNKNINRGYRKLDVWIEAVELNGFVKTELNEIKTISYKVKADIEASIFSVGSNIAEGYCRRSLKEYINFINVALGSLGENYSQIFSLLISGDIDEKWFDEYDKLHYSLENKMIRFNKANIEKLNSSGEWNDDYKIRELLENYDMEQKSMDA